MPQLKPTTLTRDTRRLVILFNQIRQADPRLNEFFITDAAMMILAKDWLSRPENRTLRTLASQTKGIKVPANLADLRSDLVHAYRLVPHSRKVLTEDACLAQVKRRAQRREVEREERKVAKKALKPGKVASPGLRKSRR